MFGPEAPPLEWDEDGIYKRSNLELYYLSNAATQLSDGQLVEVGRPAHVGCRCYGT